MLIAPTHLPLSRIAFKASQVKSNTSCITALVYHCFVVQDSTVPIIDFTIKTTHIYSHCIFFHSRSFSPLFFFLHTLVGSSNWDFVESFEIVMDSIICSGIGMMASVPCAISTLDRHFSPSPCLSIFSQRPSVPPPYHRRANFSSSLRPFAAVPSYSPATNSTPPKSRIYTVGDFMTRKDNLHVVKASTAVEDALESLVNKRVTGFPVVDDDWKLVGVVSDYDLLALDSISGGSQADTNLFPDVDSTWTTFSELQKLLGKTNGKVVGDLMTPSPLAVHESTNLEDAARMLLETKYRRLPVVDADGRLVGIITRGDIVRAALQIKRGNEKM